MYHIKPDKRSRTSADEIVGGLQTCLQFKPLRSISFTDIHKVTGISRATIYRLFDTPEDILLYLFDNLVEESAAKFQIPLSGNSKSPLQSAIEIGMQHHELIKALVENGRFDLLFRYTEQRLSSPAFATLLSPDEADPVERDYAIAQLSMSMVAAMVTWERNGRMETAAQVTEHMQKLFRRMVELSQV